MSDPLVSGTAIYRDLNTGRLFRKRGCTNELCDCTGICQEKVYIDEADLPKIRRAATARREARLDFLHLAAAHQHLRGVKSCPQCEGQACANVDCPLLLVAT